MAVKRAGPRDRQTTPAPPAGWAGRLLRFLGVLFCVEIGVILLVFPWLTWWDQNYFSGLGERWYGIWTSPFFRGAVSGLGMLNLYISFWDIVAMVRRHRRADTAG